MENAMISIPKLSQIPFETALFGGIGYTLGRFVNVNEKHSTVIFVVTSLANNILFQVMNRWGRPFLNHVVYPYFKMSPEALYIGSHTLVSSVAFLAAQQLNLIGRRVAGIGLFLSAAVFVAKVSILNQQIDHEIHHPTQDVSPFLNAMELMFHDRRLEWSVSVGPFTPKQETQRYEELKKTIKKILPSEINHTITYRDGIAPRTQTLLLQAIRCIQDRSKRLEIVELLLKKGADPKVQGWYYSSIDPIQEAAGDHQLVELLKRKV